MYLIIEIDRLSPLILSFTLSCLFDFHLFSWKTSHFQQKKSDSKTDQKIEKEKKKKKLKKQTNKIIEYFNTRERTNKGIFRKSMSDPRS